MATSDLKRMLLVLDVNGLLLDTYPRGKKRPDRPYDAKVGRFYVYKRPFCDEFLQFCLDNFVVGVWSSAIRQNVHILVEYLLKEAKSSLAFIWDQDHCTNTGFRHPDNKYKPVFLKELWKLWKKDDPNLPWEAGVYGPSNTLLVDDSAYKVVNNPPYTSIIPKTYIATAEEEDTYLDGDLRIYLQGIMKSLDVQSYIQDNPTGEPRIVKGDQKWSFLFSSQRARKKSSEQVLAQLIGDNVPVSSSQFTNSDQNYTTTVGEKVLKDFITPRSTSVVLISDPNHNSDCYELSVPLSMGITKKPVEEVSPAVFPTSSRWFLSRAAEVAVSQIKEPDKDASGMPMRTANEAWTPTVSSAISRSSSLRRAIFEGKDIFKQGENSDLAVRDSLEHNLLPSSSNEEEDLEFKKLLAVLKI